MASTPDAVSSSHGNIVLERQRDPPVEDEMGSHDIGEVITIVGRNHAQIDKMTMVIMAKSSHDRFLCLGLKCYARKIPNRAWAEKHALVVDATVPVEPRTWEGCSTHAMSIKFSEENGTRLFDDCWVNYEHLYTIREVDSMREGHVTNMAEIISKFRRAQKVMWDRVEAPFKPKPKPEPEPEDTN